MNCGRILGFRGATYFVLCILPNGHAGNCRPDNACIHRVEWCVEWWVPTKVITPATVTL